MSASNSDVIAELVLLREAAGRRAETSRAEALRLIGVADTAVREARILDGAIAQLRRADVAPPTSKLQ